MKFIKISINVTPKEGIQWFESEWEAVEKNAIYKFSRKDEDTFGKVITHKIRKEQLHTLLGGTGNHTGMIHNTIVTTPERVEEAKAMLKADATRTYNILANQIKQMAVHFEPSNNPSHFPPVGHL